MSELESALIATYLGKQELHFFAKDSYWKKGKIWAWFMNATGQIPISQAGGRGVTEQINKGVAYLKKGKIVCIYPEGTRGIDGRVHKGHSGVIRTAILAGGVPVVPVGLIGMGKLNPPGDRFHLRPGKAKIVIGKPTNPLKHAPRDQANLTDKVLAVVISRAATDALMEEIARLADTVTAAGYSETGAAGRQNKK